MKMTFQEIRIIDNSRFAEFLPLVYLPELEVKETTDTVSSASLLDLYLESPYTPTRSCVHIGVLKKKNKEKMCKIYDCKIEVVSFVIKLAIFVKFEVNVKHETDEVVSAVSFVSSLWYINGIPHR
jgi:hypothetical protein